MRKSANEAVMIARHANAFLNQHAPPHNARSGNTLKSYNISMALHLGFLETEKKAAAAKLSGECFSVHCIEDWLLWLKARRGCSPETCNARLGSWRAFLKYLGKRETSLLYHCISNLPQENAAEESQRHEQASRRRAFGDAGSAYGNRTQGYGAAYLMHGTAARIDEALSLKVESSTGRSQAMCKHYRKRRENQDYASLAACRGAYPRLPSGIPRRRS
jgi:site-specific recombinase XerD